MQCFCLDSSNSYQPRSTVVLDKSCEIIENVAGQLTCHRGSTRYHKAYKFQSSPSSVASGLDFDKLLAQLNTAEKAATDQLEGEEAWKVCLCGLLLHRMCVGSSILLSSNILVESVDHSQCHTNSLCLYSKSMSML